MVLAKNEILNILKSGELKIVPFNKNQVGAGSIDLTLSNEFRKFTDKTETIPISENTDYKKYTKKFKLNELILQPNETILGMTKEKIYMPSTLAGFLQGRTRFARLGLAVHVTASFVNPGVNNKQVLEIKNVGESEIILKPGLKICQLVLQRTEGKAKYKGKFQGQKL